VCSVRNPSFSGKAEKALVCRLKIYAALIPEAGTMKESPYVLGIWDGHDAGAALLNGGSIVFAVNEERITRRKLEVGFPERSIKACLSYAGIAPGDISLVCCSTSDPSKTFTRLFPALRERHYLLRRRKRRPPLLRTQKLFKFWLTTLAPNTLSKSLSRASLKAGLTGIGFRDFELMLVDHHRAHAAAAALTAPFDDSLVITLDGLGDGLSGTLNTWRDGSLQCIASLPSWDSLGVFFEQVTYLLNMRELEDEGKVMALADYSLEVPAEENSMLDFFRVDRLAVRSSYSPAGMFARLEEIIWKTPWEMAARMAQDTLEYHALKLFSNAIEETGKRNLAWAGGVASNIKMNMKIRHLQSVDKWYVFPHMGDGGLALGAALWGACERRGLKKCAMMDVYLGSSYTDEQIEKALREAGLQYSRPERIEEKVADLLAEGRIVLWFQGRSEYGPRALGNRSILAPADMPESREILNLSLKKRNWFQPFCPSLLREDAPQLIDDLDDNSSQFMTMAYRARQDALNRLCAVLGKDRTLRPQIVEDENHIYRRLLEEVKKRKGLGVVLNTSFNRHGEPLVDSPADAIKTFLETGCAHLAIGPFLIIK
jgi:carbamoyltransferase